MTPVTSTDADRRSIAAEVLELGETLFDALLEAAADPARAEASEGLPESELRTAADEFFQTLRGLLRVDGSPDDKADESRGREDG